MRFRRFKITACMALAGIASLAVPVTFPGLASRAFAQQAPKDVAVISIAPLDSVLKDTSYLLRACNIPEMGGIVNIMAIQYTQGIDQTKPMGATVSMDSNGAPNAIVFMPMTDREQFFGALAGMGIEPDDLGDGLFEIDTGGQVIYAKEDGGWMFVGQTEDSLNSTPADPSAILGNLPQAYDIAVRINARNVPQSIKDEAMNQIRTGYERTQAQQTDQTEEERAAAEALGEASMAQFEQMFNEVEQLILGWSINSQEQRTYFDGGVQFMEGTKLAAQADLAKDVTSDFTEFVLPNPSAKFRFSSVIAEEDRPVAKNNLRSSMAQVQNQLDQNDDMPDEAKEVVEELMAGLGKVFEDTIDEGKFDGSGSVSVADDTLRVLIGGHIADGNALAEEFKKAAAKIPNGDNAPEFEFDYATHQGMALHRVRVPLKIADPGAKQAFGDEAILTIGTGEKAYFIAYDPTGDALAKSLVDKIGTGAKVSPFEGVVQVEDLLRYAQAISPNSILDNAINTMSEYADKDKVEISTRLIKRGAVYRLSIDEGILRAAGAAAKSGGGGGGF